MPPGGYIPWSQSGAFAIIDGCTEGKDREPLPWLFNEVKQKVESAITAQDIL